MMTTHSLYVDGRWHRCRDCPGIAHIDNLSYWAAKKCRRVVMRTTGNYMDKMRAGVKRYLENPNAEEFCIHSDDEEANANQQPAAKRTQPTPVPQPQEVSNGDRLSELEVLLELNASGITMVWPRVSMPPRQLS